MPKHRCLILFLLLAALLVTISCGGEKRPDNFKELTMPDVGVTIKVDPEWTMTVWPADWSAYKSKLDFQPDYIFAPITCAKGTLDPETITRIPNWRFVGLKGKFDPNMNPISSSYPQPEGLYFVEATKGDFLHEYKRELPWPGAEGVEATVREYEETHGAGGLSDLWHAFTVTFNHNGNAMEFNMRIPSEADPYEWHEFLWSSITELKLE
jgi:hypothetical protein